VVKTTTIAATTTCRARRRQPGGAGGGGSGAWRAAHPPQHRHASAACHCALNDQCRQREVVRIRVRVQIQRACSAYSVHAPAGVRLRCLLICCEAETGFNCERRQCDSQPGSGHYPKPTTAACKAQRAWVLVLMRVPHLHARRKQGGRAGGGCGSAQSSSPGGVGQSAGSNKPTPAGA
jgi:hypothetical protein